MEIWIGIILILLLVVARVLLERRNKKLKAKVEEEERELVKKYEYLLTLARVYMHRYWEENDIYRLSMGITKINIDFDDDENISIEVILENPGVMIGKGGRHINGLTEALKRDLEYDKLKIKITEDKTWWNVKQMSYEI